MKISMAYGVSVITVAAVSALALAAVSSFLPTTGQFMANAGAAFILLAVFLGGSIFLLYRLGALRWLWLGVLGYATGFAGYGGFLALTRDDPLALPMTLAQLLTASAVGGAFGWLCASACLFTARLLMRPNTSLERTHGR